MVDEASIIDRILEAHGHISPPANSFTVRDYCERARERGVSVSEQNAVKVLRAEVEAGRLHGRKLTIDSREKWVFW